MAEFRLLPGENVLWRGRPRPAPAAADNSRGNRIAGLLLLALGGVVFLYHLVRGGGDEAWKGWVTALVFLGVGGLILLFRGRIRDRVHDRVDNLRYYVTDRRVVVTSRRGEREVTVREAAPGCFAPLRLERGANGNPAGVLFTYVRIPRSHRLRRSGFGYLGPAEATTAFNLIREQFDVPVVEKHRPPSPRQWRRQLRDCRDRLPGSD